ncbi:MAG: calcium/sodium antiporter [Kiritimatiellae bacterium]|nr:calcium/sodium antiporter [Kiritimatiellia bacterium]MBR4476179.1 calcium/sodium antiporter [Kiritimatiellia bacterium]
MYSDIPLWLSILFVVGGFVALAWSSDAFVDGASIVARVLGISPFIIGMVIIGFGTSAPELCVSLMSGLSDHANLSLGNAYGSCVFNIAAILGVASLIRPLRVKPETARYAAPVLALLALLSLALLADRVCSRVDALALLGLFAVLMPLYCWFDQRNSEKGGKGGASAEPTRYSRRELVVASLKLLIGLAVLIGSSHVLVWGAVDLARVMGVSELMIGLTIIAAGTSLPELASAVASARRGQHEFVLGNIIGSNLFNTLAVVGLSSLISPARDFSKYILTRDLPLMAILSLLILVFGINWRHPRRSGVFNRFEGLAWLVVFAVYTVFVIYSETH